MDSLGIIWSVEKTRKKNKKANTPSVVISENTRYLVYKNPVQFHCIRQGIPLPQGYSPDTFREHLTYDHLFIFEHESGDVLNRQNKDTPRFVGVLQMANGVFVYPHDDDFQQIYADRSDAEHGWKILDDGTPYWCDTHALRMFKRLEKKLKK